MSVKFFQSESYELTIKFLSLDRKIRIITLVNSFLRGKNLLTKFISDDEKGACLTVNCNPMVMPKGVEPSNDPMLSAHAAPYAIALGRRLSEGAKQ